MNTKTVAFEMEDGNEIEIDIEWSYSFTQGRISGTPEDCFPDESESEIVLPQDLDEQLLDFFKKNVLPEWRNSIERRCTVIMCDGDLAEWARDEAEANECEREDRD